MRGATGINGVLFAAYVAALASSDEVPLLDMLIGDLYVLVIREIDTNVAGRPRPPRCSHHKQGPDLRPPCQHVCKEAPAVQKLGIVPRVLFSKLTRRSNLSTYWEMRLCRMDNLSYQGAHPCYILEENCI
jgi:hypothetical protein